MSALRVLIVSQYYWPEDFAAGVYIPELAERLVAFGHDVTVITGPPSYPTGRISPGYNRPFKTEYRNGVRVIRVWFFPSPRSAGAVRRGLTAVSFAAGALPASLAVRDRPDVVLGFSPPIFMAAAAAVLARRWNVRWLLNVKDLFTESILSSGFLARGSRGAAALAWLERAVYRDADRVVVNARGFADALEEIGVQRDRLALIPDWADGEFIRPMPRQNQVRREWNLGEHLVILYSGSLGYSSNLETVIDAAAILRDEPRVRFVIVGDGNKKFALESRVASLGLTNVIFRPLQPRARLPEILATADLTLVTLSHTGGRVSTQGKLYSLLAAGRPVLAIAPAGQDARRVIDEAGCGWGVDPGDAAGVAQIVRHSLSAPEDLERKGQSARDCFERAYSLDICARQFETELLGLSIAGRRTQAIAPKESVVKRLFDVIVSAAGLVVLAPLLVVIAILIRASSPGPVIYRSDRLGHRGRRLEMLKFRTMVAGAPDLRNPDGSTYNAPDDSRVTRIGAWLRRTSLDELPQLWNVLKGEMSLVGPRPDLPDQKAFYAPEDYRRLEVRPGITGLAQTRGRNEASWAQRRRLDVEYVDSQSFLGDLVILARTISDVFRGRGVYGSHKPPAPHEG